MIFAVISLPQDLSLVKNLAERAFSSTPDSSLDEWFSFSEMEINIQQGRGVCIKALDDQGKIVGMTYAQQESPINGREGREKWVIVIAAVEPSASGAGIGSGMLRDLEGYIKEHGGVKLFTYTNKGDERVMNFYRKNGYEDAGWIKDYQYGKDNSAVFLLKYL